MEALVGTFQSTSLQSVWDRHKMSIIDYAKIEVLYMSRIQIRRLTVVTLYVVHVERIYSSFHSIIEMTY